jgi:hypothetical protein
MRGGGRRLTARAAVLAVVATAMWTAGSLASGHPGAGDLRFLLAHDVRLSVAGDRVPETVPRNRSEAAMAATALLGLYRITLSAQDVDACNFEPSCSRFMLEAIETRGFVRGALLGADRLTRCHWFSGSQSPAGAHGPRRDGAIDDPVEWYAR